MPAPQETRPGLRERKKQQTREKIALVALGLFAEQGYEETTLDEIADAAEISKRTIFSYYANKEDILFPDNPRILVLVEECLHSRPAGTSTVEALAGLLDTFTTPYPGAVLRKRIIGNSEALRRRERARYAPMEDLLMESLAQDLQAAPDDLRPRLIAASVAAAFNVAYDQFLDQAVAADTPGCDPREIFKQVLDLLRSGVEALQPRS